MPPDESDRESETLVEAAALTVPKSKLVEELHWRGANEKGTQAVLAMRLVHDVKIEVREIFDLLDVDHLKGLAKEFGIAAPETSLWSTEKGRWVDRLTKSANRKRPAQGTMSVPPASAHVAAPSASPAPEALPGSATTTATSTPAAAPPPSATYPTFAEVLSFVKNYRMGYKWRRRKEESYQAELFGALSIRFPDAEKRIEEPGGGGNRYDIVVGDTRVEIKLPRRARDISDWQGQLGRYSREKDIIVVTVEHHLTDGYSAEAEYRRIESISPRVHFVRKQL